MHIKQLLQQLKQQLACIYLLSSDLPLLLQEARDAIRSAAKQYGFTHQQILHIEPGFNWNQFTSLTQNLNLFNEKSLIDLRNPNNKFDENGIAALLHYCESAPADTVLIISMPKLTTAQQKSHWYKKISDKGVAVAIWPITMNELPQWIQQRLQQVKKTANLESCKLLAELTEGNLLAAQQAIDKLALLYPDQNSITRQEIIDTIHDHARYSVFDLVHYILAGQVEKVTRIIDHLRAEGTEPTFILWALAKEIRDLISLLEQMQHGQSLSQILNAGWPSRRPLLKTALNRLQIEEAFRLLQQMATLDRIIKGVELGNIWNELLSVSLAFAGKKS